MRTANKAEAEVLEATGQRAPYFVTDVLAEIAGIEALCPENDLRALLVLEIQEPLRELDKLDIGSMTPNELRRWVKIVDSVEPTIERAVHAITEGRKFLTAANLEPLHQVAGSWRDRLPYFSEYLQLLKKT